ncbi:winged helix DNA-binding protein [Nocardia pseudobrasiliensis]|uniref:Winged helix DNA-binding protein n=1 Tax=Nocardia pseudobrasiliensis TaxID=45979 RepID=A0A370HZF0_9NOCA|nr:winged helix DNA-binding protein [Nocardia pseudobrasiliensis]
MKVRGSDVIVFRLGAHHLTKRQAARELGKVVGACGIQNSPPGAALLAMHARADGVTSETVDKAVADDKELVQSWCMRGAPFFFPRADAGVFTAGVLPTTEAGRLHMIGGVEQGLAVLGMGLDEAVGYCGDEIGEVLSGRRLAINELGAELAGRIAPRLTAVQRKDWKAAGPYGRGLALGEAVVHFCLRILTLEGLVCFAPREGNKAPFVLVEEWLGESLGELAFGAARAELLRRYLHCYGPSSPKDFAAWLGVAVSDVDPWWKPLAGEMTEVGFDGRKGWLLTEDLEAMRSPEEVRGVRLLPPRDPYTQLRDRETIVDKKFHGEMWKTVGEPGAVLVDGKIVGIWRPRKSGKKLSLTVTAFGAAGKFRSRLGAEAEQVAILRGASSVELTVESG